MNIALIIAGGSGQRMQSEIPKQFINVYDKPVLIYTLEAFQKHPEIDAIGLVCIDGWHETVWAYARQYHITKLKHIAARRQNRAGIHLQLAFTELGKALWGNGSDFHP